MQMIDLIETKKNKKELSFEQIDYFVNEYAIKHNIPDYQASALLMAFNLNGMTDNEILNLTRSFINYSKKMEFDHLQGLPIIDKHSSGGVGDKTTIILLPILTALGYNVPKISGRGLGHTGGTIDKLESISVKTNLNFDEAKNVYEKNRCVIFQQTNDYVPADKVIYALRDVTATVDTPGLIIASILSKKFILNSDYIFIDLKVGDGALVKTLNSAIDLAEKMLFIAKSLNRKISISLTDMNQPLGYCIGNYLEISECISFLKNEIQASDLKALVYKIVTEILITTDKASNEFEAIKMIDDVINSYEAYNHFHNWLKDQGANLNLLEEYKDLRARYKYEILAPNDGYILYKSPKSLGTISVKLGAGRLTKNDVIDYLAGIELIKKTNDYVKQNETIAILYSSNPINEEIINDFYKQIELNNNQISINDIIIKTMSN